MKKGEIYIRFSLVLAAILCFAGIGGAKNVEANPAKIKSGRRAALDRPSGFNGDRWEKGTGSILRLC